MAVSVLRTFRDVKGLAGKSISSNELTEHLTVPFRNSSHTHISHTTCNGGVGAAIRTVVHNACKCLFYHRVSI